MANGPIQYVKDFLHLHDEATAHKKKKKKKKYNRRDYRGVEGAVEDAVKGKKK